MTENLRQKQKRLTRENLIDTAFKLFAQNGLTTTRTVDIAKAANVSHGTVFAHFSTQEELLTAVIEEFGKKVTQRIHELVDLKKTTTLREVLEAHLTGLKEFEAFYTRLIVERRLLPQSVKNMYIVIQSTISFHIGLVGEREMAQGNIRKMPVHLLYNTWIGLIHYYLSNSDIFSPDGSVLKLKSPELLEHYMGIITP